jgi:molybdenum cofactor cytidylyltransferase
MIALRRALRLGDAAQIAFVGAGGKSSAMFALAGQYEKALITTTTHLSIEQARSGDRHVIAQNATDIQKLDVNSLHGTTVITGQTQSKDRVSNHGEDTLFALSEFARKNSLPLLIEADGARLRAMKAPAEHEPAIPDFVDAVVVVAGLSALEKPLDEQWVHRPERFAELSGMEFGQPITTAALSSVLLHEQGGLKNIPKDARRIILLNQTDTPALEAVAQGISQQLLPTFDVAWVGALAKSSHLSAVYEPVAGIILAAGESRRLAQPKALMDWKGKPFIRQVAETALVAKLDPVIVVTGSGAVQVESLLKDLEVKMIRNSSWQEGQSSSVKAGLRSLPRQTCAALFMVVDQPHLPVSLIEALIAEHSATLAPIVAPMVDDHRTNPVLFDRSTFNDFNALEGDVGGRAIFSRYQVSWVPWLDSSLAIDVDTPEDYARLLGKNG